MAVCTPGTLNEEEVKVLVAAMVVLHRHGEHNDAADSASVDLVKAVAELGGPSGHDFIEAAYQLDNSTEPLIS